MSGRERARRWISAGRTPAIRQASLHPEAKRCFAQTTKQEALAHAERHVADEPRQVVGQHVVRLPGALPAVGKQASSGGGGRSKIYFTRAHANTLTRMLSEPPVYQLPATYAAAGRQLGVPVDYGRLGGEGVQGCKERGHGVEPVRSGGSHAAHV